LTLDTWRLFPQLLQSTAVLLTPSLEDTVEWKRCRQKVDKGDERYGISKRMINLQLVKEMTNRANLLY